ncbi:hypothetical protein CU633_00465 [Bacillus sp. V3-13]|uniref:YfjL-like protein n=1 Tax=Bacillus sp. V3-13 TaxID=2053728 RepID=UPI000C787BF2|nr:hypothetical protein [Bacillus sp. V3-13]PLR79245.1 hypothetical protein CU633_00465 [Bacillus sp. V3-13]
MRKILWYTVIFVVLVLIVALFFYGNPMARRDSIAIANDYINSKYPEYSFTVSDVRYYPGEGTFVVYVVSKDGKVTGNLDVSNSKVVHEEFSADIK